MIQKFIRRVASLLVLACFALASIGGDGCFDWGNGPQQSGPTYSPPSSRACPTGQQRYTCTVVVPGAKPAACGGTEGGTCTAPFGWTPCAASAIEAVNRTNALARLKAVEGANIPPPTCAVLPLDAMSPIYNSLVPTSSDPCACDGTGGASTSGPSCAANADACTDGTDCCSGICNYVSDVCETCRVDDENCVNDSECCSGLCSLNGCSGGALRLHDGGLGFGGGTP